MVVPQPSSRPRVTSACVSRGSFAFFGSRRAKARATSATVRVSLGRIRPLRAGPSLLQAAVDLVALEEAGDQAFRQGLATARPRSRRRLPRRRTRAARRPRPRGRGTAACAPARPRRPGWPAGLVQGHERPDALGEALAVDEAAVVGAQRLLERAQEACEQLLVDREAGRLRLDQELDGPGGERHVAGRARPVGHEAVRVDGGGDRRPACPSRRGPRPSRRPSGRAGRGTCGRPRRPGRGSAAARCSRRDTRGRSRGRPPSARGPAGPRAGSAGAGCPAARLRRPPASCRGAPGFSSSSTPLRHALAVVAQRQLRLERVAGPVGRALDAHAEHHLGPGELALGVARRRLHRHRHLDALRDVRRRARARGARAPRARRPRPGPRRCPAPPSPSTTRPIAAAVNRSPGRTKRGSAGCTITGSRTATAATLRSRSAPDRSPPWRAA